MLFCGDYVDRGHHGAEVLALVLTLRARNPGRVLLAPTRPTTLQALDLDFVPAP